MRTIVRTFRTSARLLGIAALAVLLAGCIRATQDLTLNPDDTVDGTVVFAVQRSFLDLSGISVDEFMEQITEGEGPLPAGVEYSTEPYEEDDFVGSRFTFEGAPLSAFSDPEGGDLSIVREGDVFVVSGSLDASSEELDPSGTPGVEEMLDSFDVRLSITFPGEVESATGEIDGTTVMWTPELGQTTEISARGSAIEGGGGGSALLWIVLGVVAVLVVIGLVVVMGRKGAPADTAGAAVPEGAPSAEPASEPVPPTPVAEATPPPPAPVTEPVEAPEPTGELPDTPGDGEGGSG